MGGEASLLISDFQLGMRETGFEAIGALRGRFQRPNLPAILLTGDVRAEVHARALREKITMAHKPLSPDVAAPRDPRIGWHACFARQIALKELNTIAKNTIPAGCPSTSASGRTP